MLKNILFISIGATLFYHSFTMGEATLMGGAMHLAGCCFFCEGCCAVCSGAHSKLCKHFNGKVK